MVKAMRKDDFISGSAEDSIDFSDPATVEILKKYRDSIMKEFGKLSEVQPINENVFNDVLKWLKRNKSE